MIDYYFNNAPQPTCDVPNCDKLAVVAVQDLIKVDYNDKGDFDYVGLGLKNLCEEHDREPRIY